MSAFQELVIKLKADSKGVMGELNKVTQKTSQMGQGFKGALNNVASSLGGWPVLIGGATAALGVATTAVGAFGAASFKAYTESEKVINRFESILRASGRYSEDLSQTLQDNAQRLQDLTVFDDEAILSATSKIAALAQTLNGSELKQAQTTVIALAAKLGTDLPTAASIMSKALAGNMGALGRYGIKLEDTGTQSGNLESITKSLGNSFDIAKDATNTFDGRLQQMKNSWDNILEAVGGVIAKFGEYMMQNKEVKKVVDSLSGGLQAIEKWFQSNKKFLDELAKVTADYLGSIINLVTSVGDLIGAFQDLSGTDQGVKDSGKTAADAFNAIKNAVQGIASFINGIANAVRSVTSAIQALKQAANSLPNISAKAQKHQYFQNNLRMRGNYGGVVAGHAASFWELGGFDNNAGQQLQNNNSMGAMGGLMSGALMQSINQTIPQFSRLQQAGVQSMSTLEQAARGFGDNFINIFEQAVLTGKLNFKDLAKSILADLAKIILQMTVIRPLSNAFSGFLGGLFGRSSGLSAGITSGFRAAFGGFRASGGPVMPNTAYMVGERGPELFMPKNAGSIVPNNRLQGNSQGGVTVIMNNNFALGLSENIRAQIAAETPKIVKAATAGVSAEIARGGPLARQVGARK